MRHLGGLTGAAEPCPQAGENACRSGNDGIHGALLDDEVGSLEDVSNAWARVVRAECTLDDTISLDVLEKCMKLHAAKLLRMGAGC